MKLPAVPVHSFEDTTLNFEALQRSGLFWGNGVPTFTPDGKHVSFYFRFDTPGTASQRLYIFNGSTWAGIL